MYEDDYGLVSREPRVPLTGEVLKRSVILIAASLGAGALLIWIVRFEPVLWVASFVLELVILALGCFAGQKVYRASESPHLLGFALLLLQSSVLQSWLRH